MRLSAFYETASPVAPAIISVAFMLFFGFAMTRVTRKLRLPDVTAYILSGILIGPCGMDLIPPDVVSGTEFLPDIALAFIAFSTGEFFRLSALRKNGWRVVIVTVLEAVMASAFVFVLTFRILSLTLPFSVVLSALAAATAPASTMMTIRQTGARGDFVDTLLQVVALDDVVGLIGYSVAISVALASITGDRSAFDPKGAALPLVVNLLALLLGGFFGVLMKLFITRKHTSDNRLIIAVAFLFTFCGVCALLDVSPLLGCMSMGTVYVNMTGDDKLFKQLNYFSPPILLLFFVRSGISFRLDALFSASAEIGRVPLIWVGVLYFFVRILGKYIGAYLGCAAAGKEPKVRNYLGLALIPQAGVAIGLAALGARTLGGTAGEALNTIILASSVLYELIGPACAKLSLYLSGSYASRLEDVPLAPDNAPLTPVEEIVARLNAIRSELPARDTRLLAEESAFTEAAEEQYAVMSAVNRQKHYHGRFHL